MGLRFPDDTARLAEWLSDAAGADRIEVRSTQRMEGGTCQQNWFLDLDVVGGAWAGRQRTVLRAPMAVGTEDTLPIEVEFDVIKAANESGTPSPRALFLCNDARVLGERFLVMECCDGEARPWKLQRDAKVMDSAERLLGDIASALTRTQTIVPARSHLGLRPIKASPALDHVSGLRAWLDSTGCIAPALEFALRWLECNAPETPEPVLVHGDYRNGNLMVKDGRLEAVIDWGRARWGDPLEDYAWFCIRFFRFARPDLGGGGFGPRSVFRAAYEKAAGRLIDPASERYWDTMANTVWAAVSIQQAYRFTSGKVPLLELALTGFAASEISLEALRLIDRAEKA